VPSGATCFPGDACHLPFSTGCADLVVIAHVLHLIDDWRGALEEAVRVARPGGVLAVNVGSTALHGRTALSRTFLAAVAARADLAEMPGASSTADVLAVLDAFGCRPMAPLEARGTPLRSVRDHIFRLQWNPFAWRPGTPQWALNEAALVTADWAASRFGDIDEPTATPVTAGFKLSRSP
jgi:SAM-dependent methyltransferase